MASCISLLTVASARVRLLIKSCASRFSSDFVYCLWAASCSSSDSSR